MNRLAALDLRLVPLASTVWAAALVVPVVPLRWTVLAALLSAVVALFVLSRCGDRVPRRSAVALVLLGAAAGASVSGLHVVAARTGPIAGLATERAVADVEMKVASDPMPRTGEHRPPYVLVRATALVVRARGEVSRVSTPMLVVGSKAWTRVRKGERVGALGRLSATEPGSRETAFLSVRSPPHPLAEPGAWDRAAEHLRAGLRSAVDGWGAAERGLLPALVVGDTSRMPEPVLDDFRTAGLTHLTAVSGANLTIVLGFVLGVARWAGVRSRGQPLLGVLCVAGFVVVARPDPSVVRAAAMGVVGLTGTVVGSRRHGIPAVALAVIALLLVDPWLGRSYGFALSVLATTGIVLLAGPWSDALGRWLPPWASTAIAVPLAAHLACTPLVAVLSDEVSVVAVVANMLAGPAVLPATVLGVLTMLVAAVSVPVATLCAWPAGWAVRWIVEVGTRAADVPGASLSWPTTPLGIGALILACGAAVALAPRVLPRRGLTVALTAVLVVWLVRPEPPAPIRAWTTGWPPAGWAVVACDVGQGDALVLRSGPSEAVVVDTGPAPDRVDACLRRLDVDTVPYVLLSHFHADHVAGLAGVLRGRTVGEVGVRPLAPPSVVRSKLRPALAAGLPVTVAVPGTRHRVGDVSWTVVGPATGPRRVTPTAVSDEESPFPPEESGEESSEENDAGVVIKATVRGVEILLTGDVEPAAQTALLRSGVALRADVLKVPHHGSSRQDPAFLAAVAPRLALISVGEDNDYGHPAPSTVSALTALGATVLRTDLAGGIAVLPDGDGLRVALASPTRTGLGRAGAAW